MNRRKFLATIAAICAAPVALLRAGIEKPKGGYECIEFPPKKHREVEYFYVDCIDLGSGHYRVEFPSEMMEYQYVRCTPVFVTEGVAPKKAWVRAWN
jgi:hypothetical protein